MLAAARVEASRYLASKYIVRAADANARQQRFAQLGCNDRAQAVCFGSLPARHHLSGGRNRSGRGSPERREIRVIGGQRES